MNRLYKVRTPRQGLHRSTLSADEAACLYNAHRGPLSVPVTAELVEDSALSPIGSVWQAANGLTLEVLA